MKLKLNTYRTRSFNAKDAEVFAEGAKEYLRVPLRIPPRPLRLILIALSIIAPTVTVSAQRKPSEFTRPFVVMSSQSLDDLRKKLHPDNKTEELIDSAGMQLRVAVQHEKNKTGAAAELHDASDDVYYVLDGSATLMAVTVAVVAIFTTGAANKPVLEIVPAVADQVTATLLVLRTVAVNCAVPPEETVG